jgi:hypothetical protein
MSRPHSSPVRRLALVGTLTLLLTAGNALAQSCAMCTSSFGENDPLSRAISWSILFLMAMPYTIFGTIAAIVFFSHRRAGNRPRATVIDLARAARLLRRSAPAGSNEGDLA